MVLTVSPVKLARLLVVIALVLTLASLAGQFSRFVLGHGLLMGWVRLTNVDEEANIPAWYASALLLTAAALLAVMGFARRDKPLPFASQWRLMALVFACLSMDETAQIHETINLPLRHLLHNRMTLPWTLPAGAFVLAFALYFLRFLRSLPPPTRWRFVAAGCIYVGGSIGMELVSGHYSSTHGVNMTYAILAGVEELLEMWGVTLFVYALLAHMHSEATEVRFTFVTSAGSGPARAAAAR